LIGHGPKDLNIKHNAGSVPGEKSLRGRAGAAVAAGFSKL